MDAPTLGSIFTRHARFPSSGKATLSIEAFSDRLAERSHGLDREARDPMAWVEHFFALEHTFDRRAEAFDLAAALTHKGETVLQFELAEQEFVVIDGPEDIVVASNAGSVVISRTSDLARSLRAAELPSRQQVSPSASFKPAGERAYFVTQSGAVTSVDAKLVAAALKGAQLRSEPLARVAQAPQRLAAFSPTVVQQRASPAKTEPVRQVAAFAKSVKAGEGPKVLVVERDGARSVTGDRARFWNRLASTLTDGGRQTEKVGRAAGAVAVGRQTFAVKAGGVTALVQKPVEGIGRRIDTVARRQAVISERRAESIAPRWVREAEAERPNGRGFWVPVNAGPITSARPAWVSWALSEARDARSRARSEIAGRMDPARVNVPLVAAPRTATASAGRVDVPDGAVAPMHQTFAGVDRGVTASAPLVARAFETKAPAVRLPTAHVPDFSTLEVVLPQIRLIDGAASTTLRAPLTSVGGLPATTLRALYTGLERTAEREGLRVPSIATEAFSGRFEQRRDARAAVRAEFEVEELWIEAPSRAPRAEFRTNVFALPFASEAGLRVGPDLENALGVMLSRRLNLGSHPVPTAAGQDGPLPNRASDVLFAARPVQLSAAAPIRVSSSTRVHAETVSTELDSFATPAARESTGAAVPVGISTQSWVDWAVRNSHLARAHGRGVSIAQTPSMGGLDFAVAAPTGSSSAAGSFATPGPGAADIAARNAALPAGTTSAWPSEQRAQAQAAQRFPSMFIRFDAEPGSQGPRPVRTMMDVAGPEIGLFAVPMTHDTVIDAASPRAVFNPHTAASRPMVSSPDGRPQSFVEGTWIPAAGTGPSVAIRLAPLYLQDVNARRVPPPVASSPRYSAALEDSAEEIVVPVPLWMQMAETVQPSFVAAAPAAPESSRSSYFAPTVVGTTINAGGSLSAPTRSAFAAPTRSSFAVPRPGPEGFSTVTGAGATSAAGAPSGGGSFRSALSPSGPNSSSFLGSALSLGGSAPEMTTVDSTSAATPRDADASSFGKTSSFGRTSAGASSAATPSSFPSEGRAAAPVKPASAPTQIAPPEGRFPSGMRAATARTSSASSAAGSSPAPSSTSSVPSNAAPRPVGSASAFAPTAATGVGESRSYWPSEQRRRELRQSCGGYLRFRFPSTARWWTPTTNAAVARANAAVDSVAASPGAEFVAHGATAASASSSMAASASSSMAASASSSMAASASSSMAPYIGGAFGAGLAGVAGAAVVNSSSQSSAATPGASAKADAVRSGYRIADPNASSYFPSERRAHEQAEQINRHTGARDNEAAFVALGPNGEATVMGPAAAAQLQTRKSRGGSGAVDMTVVASIAPQAPSLESMAIAGHERPHAKGKKEGQAKSGATKSDNLSLQGTVDSLAQRIYHRLKRRLAADRERFGG